MKSVPKFSIIQITSVNIRCLNPKYSIIQIISVKIDASDTLFETVLDIFATCIGLRKFQVRTNCRCWMQLETLKHLQLGFYESLMLECPK